MIAMFTAFCCVLLLLAWSNGANAANVTILTKNFSPFSYEGEGYSIDFMTEVLIDIYGIEVDITVEVLPGNQEILDTLEAAVETVDNYSVGIAGMTITSSREEQVDFLPSFFTSGLQIMVSSTNDLNSLIVSVITDFFVTMGFVLIATIIIIYTFSPLVWFFEMGYSGVHIPIFVNWRARKDKSDFIFEGFSSKWRVVALEIVNAFRWTTLTLFGTDTGHPKNIVAQYIRVLLKVVGLLILVTMNAAITTIFTNASEVTTIAEYADLKGTQVCSVAGSTSEAYLASNNIGFAIVAADSIENMFASFWSGTCDAVVYDFPALRGEISATGGDAIIVGPLLNAEYYGIAVSENNPVQELLKTGVINLLNDFARIQIIEDKWLGEVGADDEEESSDPSLPVEQIVAYACGGLVVLIAAVAFLSHTYDEKSAVYDQLKKERFDRDYTDDYRHLLEQEESTEDIFHGVGWLADKKIVPYLTRSLRVLYELEMKGRGRRVTHHFDKRDEPPAPEFKPKLGGFPEDDGGIEMDEVKFVE